MGSDKAAVAKAKATPGRQGKTPQKPREVLEGIVWILISGAAWHMLPKGGVPFLSDLSPLLSALDKGRGDQKDTAHPQPLSCKRFVSKEGDALYRRQLCSGKKRGTDIGKTKRGKGSKVMAVVNRDSRPVAVKVTSATPFESTLVEDILKERFSPGKVRLLTGEKAYDSDPLDKKLQKKAVELNAPHKRNRKKQRTQDRRKLRGYKNRWTVERFFAWLQNFRRCLVRYERKTENFLSFVHLAIIIMLLRYFSDRF